MRMHPEHPKLILAADSRSAGLQWRGVMRLAPEDVQILWSGEAAQHMPRSPVTPWIDALGREPEQDAYRHILLRRYGGRWSAVDRDGIWRCKVGVMMVGACALCEARPGGVCQRIPEAAPELPTAWIRVSTLGNDDPRAGWEDPV